MPRTSTRNRPVVNYNEGADGMTRQKTTASKPDESTVPAKGETKGRGKVNGKRKTDAGDGDEDEREKQQPKKAKTAASASAKPEDKMMPLANRTAVSSLKNAMYIGAHVSAAGGVQNAVTNAVHIGGNAFALFLKSQRKWESPALSADARDKFISGCKAHGFSAGEHALPHGSYLVNLAQADDAKAEQAYGNFVDDLHRCEALGIRLYNFHPGSTGGEPRDAALARIAAQLNRAHGATSSVVTVLENMAGAGNVVGARWEDLRDIIALVEHKDRVGVCIDTCHAFAAGHDLRTPEAFANTMRAFDKTVGLGYLKAFHLNDSKAPFNSNRDLHANIGTGFLGLRAFHSIMNDDRFRNMPMVLETPIDAEGPGGKTIEDKQIWADEIKLLESLIGMDPDGPEFVDTAARLQERGAAERSRIQEQVDKKAGKTKTGRGGKKGVKA